MNHFIKLKRQLADYYTTRDGWIENLYDVVSSDQESFDGYLKYVKDGASPVPGPGEIVVYHVTVADGVLTRASVAMRPDDSRITMPPRTYRRSWLAQWLFAHDILDDFTVFLAEYPQMKMMWDYCTEFDSDHPMWPQFSAAVKAGLGLTDAEFAEFLSYGEHGK